MDINVLDGNVHRYKKESCSAASSFWVAQDARGRVWAFEVGERSEVGALESLSPQKKTYKELSFNLVGFFYAQKNAPKMHQPSCNRRATTAAYKRATSHTWAHSSTQYVSTNPKRSSAGCRQGPMCTEC